MKSVAIASYAKRRDGSIRHRSNGSPISKFIQAPCIAKSGPWAITAWNGMQTGFSGGYQITHVPTGFCVFASPLNLRTARRALRLFATLPNQTQWRRLTNKGHMTKAMVEAGRSVRDRIEGVTR